MNTDYRYQLETPKLTGRRLHQPQTIDGDYCQKVRIEAKHYFRTHLTMD